MRIHRAQTPPIAMSINHEKSITLPQNSQVDVKVAMFASYLMWGRCSGLVSFTVRVGRTLHKHAEQPTLVCAFTRCGQLAHIVRGIASLLPLRSKPSLAASLDST